MQGEFILWMLTGIFLLFICGIAGYRFRDTCFWVVIDKRDMLSLSRLQVILWALLILSSYIALVVSKIAYGEPYPLDIQIPGALWTILGVSAASFFCSRIIKNDNLNGKMSINLNGLKKSLVLKSDQSIKGTTIVNEKPKIDFLDLFRGEEIGNYNLPDIGKIQMFLFTIIVWAAYALAIYRLIIEIPRGFDLPELSGGITVLLAISNVGYIASKAIPREMPSKIGPSDFDTIQKIDPFRDSLLDPFPDPFLIGIYAIQVAVIIAVLYAIIAFPSWLKLVT